VAAVADALAVVDRDAAVVIACSGGPDSVALAALVDEARADLDVTLAHVRHGLRDDDADLDAVRTVAAWLGRPLEVVEVEVVERGHGLEAAARDVRHRALREVAAAVGAAWVLLGHTADDQAETVLLRLARGTGPTGLGAMAATHRGLLRPLLRLRRDDVHGFVAGEGLPSVDDPHNDDRRFRRVRTRLDVLPQLDALGPDPVGAITRLASLQRDDDAALERWVTDVLRRHLRRIADVLVVPTAPLADLPVAVARRLVRRLVRDALGGTQPPTAATVARVLALGPGRASSLPGGALATVGGGWLALAPCRDDERPAPVDVVVPGVTPWAPAGLRLVAHTPDATSGSPAGQGSLALPGLWSPPRVRLDPDAAPPGGHVARLQLALPAGVGPLRVRARRDGDRVRIAVGHTPLRRVFSDAGVPRPLRDRWPVVADADDRVRWIPGLAADHDTLSAGRGEPVCLLVCERTSRRGSG
jgi:tRNA(Ile)-lysidine synthase